MRILQIRIHNLNSLRGDTTIDFTEGPLSRHQLFAIVGPTGAGKTTILDAITLALYGRSERRPKSGGHAAGIDTVMSHGAGECTAEVAFTTRNGHYLATWYRARAYKKHDKALQAPHHSLSRYSPDTKEKVIISEKKSITPGKVVEVIGLDYDRFIKSAMLTQGQFARFLKSGPGEKADILEKITGMEIYNHLGKAAFERHKAAKLTYERAEEQQTNVGQLGDEERATLEAERDAGEVTISGKRTDLREVDEAIGRRARQAELADQLADVRQKLTAARERLRALEPQRKSLTDSERVQPLRGALDNHARLTARHGTVDVTLERLATQRKIAREGQARATDRNNRAGRDLNAFLETLPALEGKLNKADRLERSADLVAGELKLLKAQLTEQATRSSEVARRTRARSEQITGLENELGGRSADDIERRLGELDTELTTARATVAELSTWLTIQRRLDRIGEIQDKIEGFRQRIAGYERDLADGRGPLARAEALVERQNLQVDNLKLRLSLNEHRRHLQAGAPCPLCGSLQHPALNDGRPATQSRLDEALRALQTASDDYQLADARQAKIAETMRGARKTSELLIEQIGELRIEIEGIRRPEGENTRSAAQLRSEITQTEARSERLVRESQSIKQLRTRLPQLRQLTTLQQTDRRLQEEVKARTTQTTQRVSDLKERLADQRREVQTLLGGDATVEEVRKRTTTRQRALEGARTTAETDLVRATAEVEKAESRLLETRAEQLELTKELEVVAGNLDNELGQLNLDLLTARLHLLTTSEEALLRRQLQAAEVTDSSLRAQLRQVTTDHEAATEAVATTPLREELLRRKTDLTDSLDEAQQTLGRHRQRLEEDDRRRARFSDLERELADLRQERDRWARINDLIGSANGKKFRAYAQAITLQRLVVVGNDHLEHIAPRYRMEYEPPAPGAKEELRLVIIDLFQNDNRRTLNTLSGGETFLVSLALALGLSDLASGRTSIQSLFIDEGFGTLDDKTLDQAMTTLEQLQAQGKIIGLISHVPQLKERIQCRIVVEPMGDGVSRVTVVE